MCSRIMVLRAGRTGKMPSRACGQEVPPSHPPVAPHEQLPKLVVARVCTRRDHQMVEQRPRFGRQCVMFTKCPGACAGEKDATHLQCVC